MHEELAPPPTLSLVSCADGGGGAVGIGDSVKRTISSCCTSQFHRTIVTFSYLKS